jgi:hypothetical protein
MNNANGSGGLSPEKLDAMLKTASQKLGMTPQQLKAMLSNPNSAGQVLSMIQKQSGGPAPKGGSMQQNIEQMLNSNPKAKKMLEDLLGGKKNG